MKMDKREIILCLLFACLFITMIFIRAFAVDADPGTTLPVHGKQSALEILEDDTSYNTWLDNLRDAGAEVASNVWSTASDMARNLLAYGVGCVANTTEEVLQVAFPDLEHYLGDLYFDWDRLEWEFTDPDDLEDFIKTGLEPYAYDSGSQAGSIVEGTYWVALPSNIYYGYVYNKVENMYSTVSNTYFCLVRQSANRVVLYWSSSNSGGYVYSGEFIPSSGILMNSTYSSNGNTYYYGGWANEFRTDWRLGSSSGQSLSIYSDINTALAALWGNGGPSSEPVLNGDVLYFDDPSFAPLGYYPSTALNFETIVNEGHTNNYDYSVVNNYNTYYPSTFSFDIPYWLYVPSTTPKLYDLPSDYDFGNIQFDYEADSSFLSGAGIVQDVYEILPLRLQNLIILFGAGTCAFIFLRR